MYFRFIIIILIFISCQKDSDSAEDQYIDQIGSTYTGNSSETVPSKVGTPCVKGFAGKYPCKGYDLLAHIDLATFDCNHGNDSWGWTDLSTQKEYVLMGLDNGTVFVDVSDPI